MAKKVEPPEQTTGQIKQGYPEGFLVYHTNCIHAALFAAPNDF